MSEFVLLEREGPHGKLILNRPEEHNPMSDQVAAQLRAHLETLAQDPGIAVVTLRGAGPSFCAGADLKFFLSVLEDPIKLTEFMRTIKTTINMLENFPHPVIAVVHGFALAGGLELLLACDMAIAAEDARIGDQHANFGIFPGGGSTQRLPRIIGQRKAKELIFMGSHITGKEAEALGLVNKAVPAAELEATAEAWVQNICEKSARDVTYMKEAIQASGNIPLPNGLDLEEMLFLNYAKLGDMQEGLKAFKEKRKPRFGA